MMHPLTTPKDFEKHEPAFRDIQQYLVSMEPPKYPFAIAAERAAKGEKLFKRHCATCHGTYGEKWSYPNRVIPLAEIGTDPTRHKGIDIANNVGTPVMAARAGQVVSAGWNDGGYGYLVEVRHADGDREEEDRHVRQDAGGRAERLARHHAPGAARELVHHREAQCAERQPEDEHVRDQIRREEQRRVGGVAHAREDEADTAGEEERALVFFEFRAHPQRDVPGTAFSLGPWHLELRRLNASVGTHDLVA